jgi:hypothetical protein
MAQAAEPDFLQPTVAPEAPSAGALAIATPPSTPVTQEDEPAGQPDLSPYDWYPVLRRPRADGWTVDVQRRFIEVLADSGSVIEACLTVGKAKSSAYALRRSPGAEGFAAAWRIAIDNAAARALDECFERALVGTDEPVFDRDGRRVGRRLRQSDRLLMFILRAYMPDRFRYAARDVRTPDEPPAPAVEPVQQAIALVEPPRPARPEELMDADTLESRLWCADILEGERPRWHKGVPDDTAAPLAMDEDFETALENAKRAAGGLPPLEADPDDDGYDE